MFARGAVRPGGGKVCDFFLQGRCRYGDHCKYEHPPPSAHTNNRYAPLSSQPAAAAKDNANNTTGVQQAKSAPHPTQRRSLIGSSFMVKRDNIVADLKNERPIWPFSAYGPGKDAPRQLLEGYSIEQSPEEMRVMYYLAQANGNPQPAIQREQESLQQVNQQIERILADPDAAVQYVIDGATQHPNRLDMVTSGAQGRNSTNPASNTSANTVFGKPSTFGAPSQAAGQASAFGKPSNPFGTAAAASTTPAFGQPSQPNRLSAFGQPSQIGATSAFGQASQLGGRGAFGQPSQLGHGNAFGQPSQPVNPSAFGRPSQPGATSTFGQPTSIGTGSPFGQPSSQVPNSSAFAQAANPSSGTGPQTTGSFGQPTQPSSSSPFAAANQQQSRAVSHGQSAFGQPSQPLASPFAAAVPSKASPFAQPAPANPANPFGQAKTAGTSPFAQQSATSQPQANTSAIKAPFPTHAHPPPSSANAAVTATPPLQNYAQHQGDMLRAWFGRPVTIVDGAAYYSKTGNAGDASSLERIWHPTGPPPANAYLAEHDDLYAKAGPEIEVRYRACAEKGLFDGSVPLLAPKMEWIRFDV